MLFAQRSEVSLNGLLCLNIKMGFVGKPFERNLKRYSFVSQFVKNRKVLDLGCNLGYGSCLLMTEGAKKVVGIDISSEMISEARKSVKKGLSFEQMDGTGLRFPNNYFDVVVSLEVIEHIVDAENCLSEIKRVLNPGGLLLLSTPNGEILPSYINASTINPIHIREYAYPELEALLSNHFHISSVFVQGWASKKRNLMWVVSLIIMHRVNKNLGILFSRVARKSTKVILGAVRGKRQSDEDDWQSQEIVPLHKIKGCFPTNFIVVCKK